MVRTPEDIANDEGPAQRRPYASPVCYAHEFESALAERAAVVPHAVYRAIVEQASDAMVFADRDGTIRLWNRGAEKLFGYSAVEALGASLDLIIPERFRPAHWEGFRRAIDTGQLRVASQARVTRSQHRDGSKLYVEFSFGLARDGAGAVIGAFAIGRDCSDRFAAAAAPRAHGRAGATEGR